MHVVPPEAFLPPVPGDIVYCRFPEKLGKPGPKPRPALVTGLVQFDDGSIGVVVAYGTSQRLGELHSGEFAIAPGDGEPYRTAGLSFPTKFDLRKLATLPYTDVWFQVPPRPSFGQTPKLGTLHASLVKRATAAYNAVHEPTNPSVKRSFEAIFAAPAVESLVSTGKRAGSTGASDRRPRKC